MDEVVATLRDALARVAVDADRASMEAYLRNRFVFLGVKTPARRAATRPIVRDALVDAGGDDLLALVGACWAQPEREFHHVGTDALASHVALLAPPDIDVVGGFITSKSWWDTVDAIATGCVEPLVARSPELVEVMDRWIDDTDVWLARTAILHQLKEGERTDADRLYDYCLRRSGDSEFFIRKAIGWALRQYARSDPDGVRGFVDSNRDRLSALSVREATRHLRPHPRSPE